MRAERTVKAVAEELGITLDRLKALRLLYAPKPSGLEQAKPNRTLKQVEEDNGTAHPVPAPCLATAPNRSHTFAKTAQTPERCAFLSPRLACGEIHMPLCVWPLAGRLSPPRSASAPLPSPRQRLRLAWRDGWRASPVHASRSVSDRRRASPSSRSSTLHTPCFPRAVPGDGKTVGHTCTTIPSSGGFSPT